MARIVVAAGVVGDREHVLLTRRGREAHLGGYWEFPGGKLEEGEGPEETVVRELREECGIDIEVDDIFDVTFHSYAERDVLLLFYTCRRVAGDVQNLGVAEHAWVRPAQLADYELAPANAKLARKLARRG